MDFSSSGGSNVIIKSRFSIREDMSISLNVSANRDFLVLVLPFFCRTEFIVVNIFRDISKLLSCDQKPLKPVRFPENSFNPEFPYPDHALRRFRKRFRCTSNNHMQKR